MGTGKYVSNVFLHKTHFSGSAAFETAPQIFTSLSVSSLLTRYNNDSPDNLVRKIYEKDIVFEGH